LNFLATGKTERQSAVEHLEWRNEAEAYVEPRFLASGPPREVSQARDELTAWRDTTVTINTLYDFQQ
jgi:hypothetical protein